MIPETPAFLHAVWHYAHVDLQAAFEHDAALSPAAAKRPRDLPERQKMFRDALTAHLRECDAVIKAEVADSFRRKRDTIGDLDVLVASAHPERSPRSTPNASN